MGLLGMAGRALCCVVVALEVMDMLKAARGTRGGTLGHRAACILGDLAIMTVATWLLW